MIKRVKKSINKKKEISINDLALMIANNAVTTDKKIDNLSVKLEKHIDTSIENLAIIVAKGFSSVDDRFDVVDKRFDRLETRMDTMDSRMGILETRVGHIEQTVMSLDSKLEEVNKSLVKIEESTGPLLTGYRIMQSEIRELVSRVTKLEQKAKISK
ncbi:hypothetical protein IT400_03070 [Candidatus Nomurabacteria bacterium]|nr:hypothetical protein [Candidatus Nomurabacteria bacterium]